MQITVQLSPDLAAVVNSAFGAPVEGVTEVLQRYDAALTPMNPGVDDQALRQYFVVEVDNAASAQQVIEDLLKQPGVEAAYIKPQATPP